MFFSVNIDLCHHAYGKKRSQLFTNYHIGGVHKLRLQDLSFFDHLPPLCLHSLRYKSLQKVDFFDHLPPSSCKRSLWTPPKVIMENFRRKIIDVNTPLTVVLNCILKTFNFNVISNISNWHKFFLSCYSRVSNKRLREIKVLKCTLIKFSFFSLST